MAVKYCGDCKFFDVDEGERKGYCSRTKAYVWDDDFIPEDDEHCYYHVEKDNEE